jgi:hypothetical protein
MQFKRSKPKGMPGRRSACRGEIFWVRPRLDLLGMVGRRISLRRPQFKLEIFLQLFQPVCPILALFKAISGHNGAKNSLKPARHIFS